MSKSIEQFKFTQELIRYARWLNAGGAKENKLQVGSGDGVIGALDKVAEDIEKAIDSGDDSAVKLAIDNMEIV